MKCCDQEALELVLGLDKTFNGELQQVLETSNDSLWAMDAA